MTKERLKNQLTVSFLMPETQLEHAIKQDSFHLNDRIFDSYKMSRLKLLKDNYGKMINKSKHMKSSDFWAEKYRGSVMKRTEFRQEFAQIRKVKLDNLRYQFGKKDEKFKAGTLTNFDD